MCNKVIHNKNITRITCTNQRWLEVGKRKPLYDYSITTKLKLFSETGVLDVYLVNIHKFHIDSNLHLPVLEFLS